MKLTWREIAFIILALILTGICVHQGQTIEEQKAMIRTLWRDCQ
jgi:hypothetical protein